MIPKWDFWAIEMFWIYMATMFIAGLVRNLCSELDPTHTTTK